MTILQNIAFFSLASIFILRAPAALKEPKSRLSWGASGVGSAALLTLGTVIPQSVLDGFLGGTNIINLAQNVLATIAFWLVTQAALHLDNATSKGISGRLISVIILIFSFFYFSITDRGQTRYEFIPDHILQTSTWMYASIYMGAICGISLSLVTGLNRGAVRQYLLFQIGGILVALASLDEIVYLTLAHFSVNATTALSITFTLFDPLFYSGIIFIVTGIAWFSLSRSSRSMVVRWHIWRLTLDLNQVYKSSKGEPLIFLYEIVINIRDSQIADNIMLKPMFENRLLRAENFLGRRMGNNY